MKKEIILSIIACLVLISVISTVLAVDVPKLNVTAIDKGSTVISEFNDTASYELKIENLGATDTFEIYSYVGFEMFPKEKFQINEGNSTLNVKVNPLQRTRNDYKGYINFAYQLIGEKTGTYQDTLLIKIVPFKEAIELSANIKPTDTRVELTVKNLEEVSIKDVSVRFTSQFFDKTETLSLSPLEKKTVYLNIDKSKTAKLKSGAYIVTGTATVNGKKVEISGMMNYLENESISTTEKSSGFIIISNEVTKNNIGNTPIVATIRMKRNAISRLFTTFSTPPNSIERSGLSVNYVWQKSLNPSESLFVKARTNYTIPFVIIILIIVIALLARMYSLTSLSVAKRVSFVRTRGGEFALKVTINVKARKSVENVRLHDRIPPMSKLYENFVKAPDNINHATNSLSWNIGSLNAGEERVFSYIIYNQKLKIVGRYELPRAVATFTLAGKPKSINSNRAFFLAETARGDVY